MNKTPIKSTKSRSLDDYLDSYPAVPGFSYRLMLLLATCNVHGKGFLQNAAEICDAKQPALRRWIFEDHIPGGPGPLLQIVENVARKSAYLEETESSKYAAWLLFGDAAQDNPTQVFWASALRAVTAETREVIKAISPSPLDDWDAPSVEALATTTLQGRIWKGSAIEDMEATREDLVTFVMRIKYSNNPEVAKDIARSA